METLTFPFTPALAAGFAAVLPHTSADKFTPVLAGVCVTPQHILATDRYSIGRYRHSDDTPAESDGWMILPRDAAEWIARYKFDRYAPALTLTITPDALTLTNDAGAVVASRAHVLVAGNYPPVARLFPEVSDDAADVLPFHLGADKLADVVKSAQLLGRADKSKIYLSTPDVLGKYTPVHMTVGDRFDALLQPVTPTR